MYILHQIISLLGMYMGFPGGLVVENMSANAGDIREASAIPGSRRSPGGRHGNSLQYSCLENPTDKGAWWATVHRVAKSRTQLKWLRTAQHSTGMYLIEMYSYVYTRHVHRNISSPKLRTTQLPNNKKMEKWIVGIFIWWYTWEQSQHNVLLPTQAAK